MNEEDTEKNIKFDRKKPDIILSDMAANTTGHKQTDHLRTTQLTETALEFAINNLEKGGFF